MIDLLVSQLLFGHHHLCNMPEGLILHLFTILGDVAEADAGDLAHVLGRKLKRVSGTAVESSKSVLQPLATTIFNAPHGTGSAESWVNREREDERG